MSGENQKEKRKKRGYSPDQDEGYRSFVQNVSRKVSSLFKRSLGSLFTSKTQSPQPQYQPQTQDATDSSSDEDSTPTSVINQPPTKRMRYNSPGIIQEVRSSQESHSIRNQDDRNRHDDDTYTFRYSAITPPPFPRRRKTLFEMRAERELQMQQSGQRTADTSVKRAYESPRFDHDAFCKSFCSARTTIYDDDDDDDDDYYYYIYYDDHDDDDIEVSSHIEEPNIKSCKTRTVNTTANSIDKPISSFAKSFVTFIEQSSSEIPQENPISETVTQTIMDETQVTGNNSIMDNQQISYNTQELQVPNTASLLSMKKISRSNSSKAQITASCSSTTNVGPNNETNMPSTLPKKGKSKTKSRKRVARPKGEKRYELRSSVSPVILPAANLQIDPENLPKFNLELPPVSSANLQLSSPSNSVSVTEPQPTENVYSFTVPVIVSNDEYVVAAAENFTFKEPQNINAPNEEKTEENEDIKENDDIEDDVKNKKEDDDNDGHNDGNNGGNGDNNGGNSGGNNEGNNEGNGGNNGGNNEGNNGGSSGGSSAGGNGGNSGGNNGGQGGDDEKKKKFFGNPDDNREQNQDKKGQNKRKNYDSFDTPKEDECDAFGEKSERQEKNWRCSTCWVLNKDNAQNCVCCSVSKLATEKVSLPTCSVCKNELNEVNVVYICSDCEIAQINNCAAPEPSNWRFNNDWDKNNKKTNKSCDDKESDWRCGDCWINNKSNIDKCVACGGNKPGSTLNSKPSVPGNLTSSSFQVTDKLFENVIKAQADKWECSFCLVKNDKNRSKCTCCEAGKPGLINEKTLKSFNFGVNANTFKFGINVDTQTDKSKNMDTEQSSMKWESNNNASSKPPSFIFTPKNDNYLIDCNGQFVDATKLQLHFNPDNLKTNKEMRKQLVENVQEVPTLNIVKPVVGQSVFSMGNLPENKEFTSHLTPFNQESLCAATIGSTPRTAEAKNANTFISHIGCNPNLFGTAKSTVTNVFTSEISSLTSTSVCSAPMTTSTNADAAALEKNEPPITSTNFKFTFGENNSMAMPAEKAVFCNPYGNSITSTEMIPGNFRTNAPMFSFTAVNKTGTDSSMTGNTLPGDSALSTANQLGDTKSEINPTNTGNDLKPSSTLSATSGSGFFGGTTQEQNTWPNTNTMPENVFVSNQSINNSQVNPKFTFGSPNFSANIGPCFTANTTNIFAPTVKHSNAPSVFSNSSENQKARDIFGNQHSSNSSSRDVFGNASVAPAASGTFNILNPTIPAFEASPLQNPVASPSFNFGAQAPSSSNVFGFGQQPAQQFQPVYNFGTTAPQFNMGSAPAPAGRRVRKAVRRTTPR